MKNAEKTFTQKVLDVVRKIPKGKTMTYKDVAMRAGSPNAMRVVGSIMKSNYDPTVPCHRVVPADFNLSSKNGKINVGEYNRGIPEKIRKLRTEGAIK